MGATFSSLSTAQQAALEQFVDGTYRPVMGQIVRLLSGNATSMLAAALASPSGATSTAASPAADSVLGLLASLTGSEAVPVAYSGLSGISPLPAALLVANLANLSAVLSAYLTAASLQNFALTVGAANLNGNP